MLYFIAIIGGLILGLYIAFKIGFLLYENEKAFADTQAQSAVYQAKYELLHEFVIQKKKKKMEAYDMTFRAMTIVMDKVQNPIPHYHQMLQTSQNSPNTAVQVQETPFIIDRGGAENETIKLRYRGGLNEKDVQSNGDGYLNCNGYKMPIPALGADVQQFGNTGIYAGGCKNCNNRFVTKKANTNTCSEECHEQHKRK